MRRALLLPAFAALLALGWWLTRQTPPPPLAPEPTPIADGNAVAPADLATSFEFAPDATEVLPAARARSAPLRALPDDALPLAQQLEALIERALAGDPIASCRLVLEHARCQHEQRASRFAATMERSLIGAAEQASDELMIGALVQAQANAAESNPHCAGAQLDRIPDRDSMLRAVAARLSARQRVVLAMTAEDGSLVRLLQGGRRSGSSSSEHVVSQFLVDHDLQFLQAGIQAGDPLALEGMMLLHLPNRMVRDRYPLRQHHPDPYRYAGYGLLMRELFGPAVLAPASADMPGRLPDELLDAALLRLTPDQLTQLHASVRREAARWRRLAGEGRAIAVPAAQLSTGERCLG